MVKNKRQGRNLTTVTSTPRLIRRPSARRGLPLGSAVMNYLIPLMIGARDVAFPRLNALSYWVYLLGRLFIYSSWVLGGAPDGGCSVTLR